MAIKKRFTFFTDDYPAVTCDSCYEDQNEYYTGPAIDRLAEYEATGLMPAEVAALAQELKYAKQQCRYERHGRWIDRIDTETPMHECSVCGARVAKGLYEYENPNRYCYHCGAKMEETDARK